jgi:hypothetical protein
MLLPDERALLKAQIKLGTNLGLGVALSLIPAAGLGSLAAIWVGWAAKKTIARSDEKLVGHGMANWCLIVGSLGLVANLVYGVLLVFCR